MDVTPEGIVIDVRVEYANAPDSMVVTSDGTENDAPVLPEGYRMSLDPSFE